MLVSFEPEQAWSAGGDRVPRERLL